jgi:hypothetical protein
MATLGTDGAVQYNTKHARPSHLETEERAKKLKMASSQPSLSATYTSTTNAPFTLSHPISSPTSRTTTVETKTKYLSELRQSVTSLQGQINRELTARMEEDKARESGAAAANGKKVVDDEKEEENYGEEMQEEEED